MAVASFPVLSVDICVGARGAGRTSTDVSRCLSLIGPKSPNPAAELAMRRAAITKGAATELLRPSL